MKTSDDRTFLLINPNTNAATTQRLQDTLRPQLPAGVRLDVVTASFGSHYIACESSHAVAAHACLACSLGPTTSWLMLALSTAC